MNTIIKYFKETRAELQEVTWPTKTQTITFTLLVIVISATVAIFLGAIDFSLKTSLTSLLKNLN